MKCCARPPSMARIWTQGYLVLRDSVGCTAQRRTDAWIYVLVGSCNQKLQGKTKLFSCGVLFPITSIDCSDKKSMAFTQMLSPLFFHFLSDSPLTFILQSIWKLETIKYSWSGMAYSTGITSEFNSRISMQQKWNKMGKNQTLIAW